MKSKKGFTLVELLAVIAILAILVIMALPAVLRMYNQARINTFQNEVRKLYTTAQQRFVLDSVGLGTTGTITYNNNDTNPDNGKACLHTIDITGNSDFKYQITFNSDGKVTGLKATNGTYFYDSGTVTDLQVQNIEVDENAASVVISACTEES